METRLHVSGLPPHIASDDLSSRFRAFGGIKDAVVVRERAVTPNQYDESSASRGFGYVTLVASHQACAQCVRLLDKARWQHRVLRVSVAREHYLERLRRERLEAEVERVTPVPSPGARPASEGPPTPGFPLRIRGEKVGQVAFVDANPKNQRRRTFEEVQGKSAAEIWALQFEMQGQAPGGERGKTSREVRDGGQPQPEASARRQVVRRRSAGHPAGTNAGRKERRRRPRRLALRLLLRTGRSRPVRRKGGKLRTSSPRAHH